MFFYRMILCNWPRRVLKLLDLTSGWTFPALKTSSIILFAIAYSTATMSNPIVSNVKLSGEYHTSCEGNKVHSPSASRPRPVVPDKFSNYENQANNLHRHLPTISEIVRSLESLQKIKYLA